MVATHHPNTFFSICAIAAITLLIINITPNNFLVGDLARSPSPTKFVCKDSDNGRMYQTKGVATITGTTEKKTDTCVTGSDVKLREYYCGTTPQILSEDVNCKTLYPGEYYCSGGVCIPRPCNNDGICTDNEQPVWCPNDCLNSVVDFLSWDNNQLVESIWNRPPGYWISSTIAASGYSGMSDIIVEISGNKHLTYLEKGTNNVVYGSYSSGKWTFENTGQKPGFPPSIILDASGNPVIGAQSAIVFKSAGVWEIEYAELLSGHAGSIALDSSGVIHLAYDYNPASGAYLTFASRTSPNVWIIERVEKATWGITQNIHLVFDSQGAPHITFSTPKDIRHAWKESGVWKSEIIDTLGKSYNSLAIDNQDRLHVSYYDSSSTTSLRYAIKENGKWTTELVDNAGWDGEYTDIKIDQGGTPIISYLERDGKVKIARKMQGSWTVNVIDQAASYDSSIDYSLPLASNARDNSCGDNNCNPSLGEDSFTCAADCSCGDGLCNERDENGFTCKDCAFCGNNIQEAGEQCDGTDAPACQQQCSSGCVCTPTRIVSQRLNLLTRYYSLWYAEKVGNGAGNCGTNNDWNCVGVTDNSHDTGRWSSSATDSAGKMYIVFNDLHNNLLKYTDLSIPTVIQSTVGSTSMIIDKKDIPHVSVGTMQGLMYLHKTISGGNCGTANDWQCDTVDVESSEFTSIKMDSTGNVHIAYRTISSQDLKYAFFDGSTWNVQAIETLGNVGTLPQLVLDSQNVPWIIYTDDANFVTKIAHFVGSGGNCGTSNNWLCEVFQKSRSYYSIAIDGQGKPMIAFQNLLSFDPLQLATLTTPGSGNCAPGSNWNCQIIETSPGNEGRFYLSLSGGPAPRLAYTLSGWEIRYDSYIGGTNGNCGPSNDWLCEMVDAIDGYNMKETNFGSLTP